MRAVPMELEVNAVEDVDDDDDCEDNGNDDDGDEDFDDIKKNRKKRKLKKKAVEEDCGTRKSQRTQIKKEKEDASLKMRVNGIVSLVSFK